LDGLRAWKGVFERDEAPGPFAAGNPERRVGVRGFVGEMVVSSRNSASSGLEQGAEEAAAAITEVDESPKLRS
jgi:hypothetical protein